MWIVFLNLTDGRRSVGAIVCDCHEGLMGVVAMPSPINEGWFPLIVESNSHNIIHLVSLNELCLAHEGNYVEMV